MTTQINERVYTDEGIVYEMDRNWSTEAVTVTAPAAGVNAMTILGRITKGAVTADKTDTAGANKGAIALANPAFAAFAKIGIYKLICIEPYNAVGPVPAVYELEDPDGVILGQVTAGVAYDGVVKFTKAIGTADVAGDVATITLSQAAGSGKYVPLTLDGHDGSEIPVAILRRQIDDAVAQRDVKVAALTRGPAVVQDAYLGYPAGAEVYPVRKAMINAALLQNANILVKSTLK